MSDPEQTFLLTHDGRVGLDELERLLASSRCREEPVELIALSTCETAAEFYRQLGAADQPSKAEGLPRAQLLLLADARYREPFYWAPFLLIGNWL